MTITPISSIGHRGYTKNIYFEARNRDNRESHSIRNTAMAVPLTVLLAMSPLNPVLAERNSVFGEDNYATEMVEQASPTDEIKFVKSKDGHGMLVMLADENNDSFYLDFQSKNADGKYQSVTVCMPFKGELNKKTNLRETVTRTITEIRPLKYTLMGDDGTSDINFSFKQVRTKESPVGYSSDKLADFLEDFINGKIEGMKNDGAVKYGAPLDLKIRMGTRGNFVNGAINTKWLDEGRAVSEDWGRTLTSVDVETSQGKYRLFAVSTDRNNDDFESVIIKKDGEGEFKVAGVKLSHINLEDRAKIGDFNMGVIELYKRNSEAKVRITDQKLFDALWDVTKDTRFNNAYSAEMVEAKMRITGDGLMVTTQ